MQRFLLFILIVVFTCILLTRLFMSGLDPVTFTAAAETFKSPIGTDPVFNRGMVLLDTTWSQGQLVYLCKILMLVIIVLVAVLNYKSFVSEPAEDEDK